VSIGEGAQTSEQASGVKYLDGTRIGDPIQALAFRGGEAEPEEGHAFAPIPAAMVAFCRESDLRPEVIRFPASNRVAVPICQNVVLVLSDRMPGLESYIYVLLVVRSAP
jgi:hypothetical protein